MLSVKSRQKNLKYLCGYYKGKIDGKNGSQTKAALKAFQKQCKLTVDGVYGIKTDKKLVGIVKSLQKKLGGKSCPGVIGPITVKRIKAKQKIYKMKQNGVASGELLKKLHISPWYVKKTVWTGQKYFKKSEFKCECGGKYCAGYNGKEVDPYLLDMLNAIRKKYGPVIITSGIRCKRYNASLKGSSATSRHLLGKAADIYVPGASKSQVMALAKKQPHYHYTYTNASNMGNAVHVDVK